MGISVSIAHESGPRRPRWRRLTRRTLWAGAAAVVVLGAAGGVAWATVPDAQGVIHACYAKANGSLGVIDTGAGQHCQAGQVPLAWGARALSWQGNWSATTSYQAHDAVALGGSSYLALRPGRGHRPGIAPHYWALLAKAGKQGATGPTGPPGVPSTTVTSGSYVMPAGTEQDQSISCPSGVATGGGVSINNGSGISGAYITANQPLLGASSTPVGWQGTVTNTTTSATTMQIWVVCSP